MRSSGILMHISSLPSPYGIGTLGKEAYRFVDFLREAGQSYWQMLPIGTTSYGDSPYQSFSTFAGNPYFIDLDLLCEEGLLEPTDYENVDFGRDSEKVDYGQLFLTRQPILRKAFGRGIARDQSRLEAFCRSNSYWLEDFALYMAVKAHFGLRAYNTWDEDIRLQRPKAMAFYRKLLEDEVQFHCYVQYLFFQQWERLKAYANASGIRIIGDIPIYVAEDSADTWAHPELFELDEKGVPLKVAGVPPDAFTDDGQLWGNPVYRWEAHKAQDYDWWLRRLRAAIEIYDVVRIDHFRGFESFYAVDYGAPNARQGEWLKGPGMALFKHLKRQTRGFKIIAEDLGYITDDVRRLLTATGYPGMKIMLFGFNAGDQSDFIPFRHEGNCISYIGTHDNDTFMGWMQNAPKADVALAKRYMCLNRREGYHWGAIRTLLETGAALTILQMQDILGMDNSARMNLPSTVGGNWQWRALPGACSSDVAKRLRLLTTTYGRLDGQSAGCKSKIK